MPNNQPSTTWKDWVFSWPTYVIMGVALAALVDKTGAIQPLLDKVFAQDNEK